MRLVVGANMGDVMTRVIEFDTLRKFQLIYDAVTVGAVIAQKQYQAENNRPIPFDKQRLLGKIIRKLKAISHDTGAGRTLNSMDGKIIDGRLELEQPEHEMIVNFYEKLDWTPAIMDEVVDVLDWFCAADKHE